MAYCQLKYKETGPLKAGEKVFLSYAGRGISSLKIIYADTIILPDTLYRIQHSFCEIVYDIPIPVKIAYLEFPEWISRRYQKYPDSLFLTIPYSFKPQIQLTQENVISENLKTSGSIARALGIGNTQDLVLNSNLNLQVRGKLQKDISVIAAVSDDNNPIQPEGNTQQIQDFDKVYIQLESKGKTAVVGDFEMNKPMGYFMSFHKKSRGISLQQTHSKNGLTWQAKGAVSRGRFARQIIQGIEGVQGPYRLLGANGELQIILISGTEAVYIDGNKMMRGDQLDYVIDYNLGEITFSNRHQITRLSRIIIEFQYADRNYGRSVYLASFYQKIKNKEYYLHGFSEQDLKNQPFGQTLTDEQKRLLNESGDSISQLSVSSETPSPLFTPGQIMYRRLDTVVNGKSYPIYAYTSSPMSDTLFYTLSFSFVGEGKGDYRISSNSANGRIFLWVAPDLTGAKLGDYAPVRILIAPNQRQMISGGIAYRDSTRFLRIEGAISRHNINTFSNFPFFHHIGYGAMAEGEKRWKWGRQKFSISGKGEIVSRQFKYIERYREVEFFRQWSPSISNTGDQTDSANSERWGQITLNWNPIRNNHILYTFSGYQRTLSHQGIKHNIGGDWIIKKWHFKGNYSQMHLESKGGFRQNFQTSGVELIRKGRWISLQSEGRWEENIRYQNTIQPEIGSFRYRSARFSIFSGDSNSLPFDIYFLTREDEQADSTRIRPWQNSRQIGIKTNWNRKKGGRYQLGFSARRTYLFQTLQDEEFALLRLDIEQGFLKGVFHISAFAQSGSGQELKRQYAYQEVAAGNGAYQWNDYNQDGIQQLNEFEPAVFKDKARYIRIFLPSNEYIKVWMNQANLVLNIQPARWKKWKSRLGKFVSKISNLSSLRLDEKSELNRGYLRTLGQSIEDESLLSAQRLYRNTFFINRSKVLWGGEWTFQKQEIKLFLLNGTEFRSRTEHLFQARFNPSEWLRIQGGHRNMQRKSGSFFFSQGNFGYKQTEWFLQMEWVYRERWRFTPEIKIQKLAGLAATNVQGGQQKYLLEIRYTFQKNAVLQGRYEWADVLFDGDVNSPLAFDALGGYLPGLNQTWGLQSSFTAGKQTQLSLHYDGRLLPAGTPVHWGRIEARYLF